MPDAAACWPCARRFLIGCPLGWPGSVYFASCIMSKRCLLHGGSLRGPPNSSASGRCQYEGIENGGLNRRNLIRHGKRAAERRLFSFVVVRQIIERVNSYSLFEFFQENLICLNQFFIILAIRTTQSLHSGDKNVIIAIFSI